MWQRIAAEIKDRIRMVVKSKKMKNKSSKFNKVYDQFIYIMYKSNSNRSYNIHESDMIYIA